MKQRKSLGYAVQYDGEKLDDCIFQMGSLYESVKDAKESPYYADEGYTVYKVTIEKVYRNKPKKGKK